MGTIKRETQGIAGKSKRRFGLIQVERIFANVSAYFSLMLDSA